MHICTSTWHGDFGDCKIKFARVPNQPNNIISYTQKFVRVPDQPNNIICGAKTCDIQSNSIDKKVRYSELVNQVFSYCILVSYISHV